jgi:hypothetical protein
MATVRNLASPGVLDKSYESPNRTGATTPVAAVTPLYKGEIYQWTSATGTKFFRATGLTVNDWAELVQTQAIGA